MIQARANVFFERMDEFELGLCLRINRACHRNNTRRFFAVVSRLGDGVFWYSLILVLPLVYGRDALPASLHMAAVSAVGVIIYKILKHRLVRRRPFITHTGIRLGTAPLDEFSFPSGHTLHAVAFTTVALAYYPMLAWLLVPFTGLVAASRVVLGLHYPTDVLAGAALGASLAAVSMLF
jgi:undecaprenyl-diphosphatase